MKSKVYSILLLGTALCVFCCGLSAQTISSSRYKEAQQLRASYRFEQAKEAFTREWSATTDSLYAAHLTQCILWCENGMALSQYIGKPHVLGSVTVPAEEFFLYYDLCPSGRWVTTPRSLLRLVNDYSATAAPLFYRNEATTLVFSARDTLSGTGWDLYQMHRLPADSTIAQNVQWSAPQKLGPQVNSGGNERFPLLSRDGKTLYFSSNGHYGMGGYNLYQSHWNEAEQAWGPAVNLGIPFSSTANDFLFMIADNAQYAYFASTRAHQTPGEGVFAADSLTIYKVEYESAPILVAPAHQEEVQQTAALLLPGEEEIPEASEASEVSEASETSETSEASEAARPTRNRADSGRGRDSNRDLFAYTELIQQVQQLTQAVKDQEQALAQLRAQYAALALEGDKAVLARTIEEKEFLLMDLQDALLNVQRRAREAENQFLTSGIMPTRPSSPRQDAFAPAAPAPFAPVKQTLGALVGHSFQPPVPPVPPVDLTFRIENLAEIVTLESLPQDLFYRIKLFTIGQKASMGQLKGICPVFEEKVNGRYVYYAGQFASYAEVSKALTTVKKRGISGAVVVAYYQGKSLSVQAARKRESSGQTAASSGSYRIFLGSGTIDPALVRAVGQSTTKDIVKVAVGNNFNYYIGPFGNLTEANAIVNDLLDQGFYQVTIESVTN